MQNKPICKGKQLFNISAIFHGLMRTSHNAIPEPCTTMEIVVVPQIWDDKKINRTLKWEVFFKAKYTNINQEQVTQTMETS